MFAVVKTGGKQYRVAKNDVIKVERLDAEEGEVVALDDVLMVGGDGAPKVGSPALDGAVVEAEVLAAERTRKIFVFKKKRRQNYRRRAGHRQHRTVLRVTDISLDGPKHSGESSAKAAPKKAAAKKASGKTAASKKAASKKAESKTAESKKAEGKAAAKKSSAKKSAAKKSAAKTSAAKSPDSGDA